MTGNGLISMKMGKRKVMYLNKKDLKIPEVREALDTLEKVTKTEGLGVAKRVYATATSQKYEKEWIEKHKVKPTRGDICIARLINKHCTLENSVGFYFDHAQLWLKDGKPYIFTFQPYELDNKRMKQLVEYCEKYGLEFVMHTTPAFHFPSAVLWIEVTKQ